MIQYRDFVPQQTEAGGLLHAPKFEAFEAAVEQANLWVAQAGVKVLNIETVVLPNLWSSFAHGTNDASIAAGEITRWNQFVRVWYSQE